MEIINKYNLLSWDDEISQSIQLSLEFRKIVMSKELSKERQLVEIEKILKKLKKDKRWKNDEKLRDRLLEFFDSTLVPKDENHWTSLCRENPYQLIGLKQRLQGKELIYSIAKAVDKTQIEWAKILRPQGHS